MNAKEWKKVKTIYLYSFLCLTILAAISSAFIWAPGHAVITILGALSLAAGFYITELLIGVLTGVKKANSTAIVLVLILKLSWWVGIFLFSKKMKPDWREPLALGMGAFLLALLVSAVAQHGWPKISDNIDVE